VATRRRTLDDRHKGLLRRLPWLEDTGEVRALPPFRNPQVQRAEAGDARAVAIPVARSGPPLGAFVPAGADHAPDIGLRDQVQHRLGSNPEETAPVVPLEQLGAAHGDAGHRGLLR
jgi:hypothetical protein